MGDTQVVVAGESAGSGWERWSWSWSWWGEVVVAVVVVVVTVRLRRRWYGIGTGVDVDEDEVGKSGDLVLVLVLGVLLSLPRRLLLLLLLLPVPVLLGVLARVPGRIPGVEEDGNAGVGGVIAPVLVLVLVLGRWVLVLVILVLVLVLVLGAWAPWVVEGEEEIVSRGRGRSSRLGLPWWPWSSPSSSPLGPVGDRTPSL